MNLTTAKLYLPIISRIHTSKVSKETFFHTQTRLAHFSPRSNIGTRLSIAHFSPDRSTHRRQKDPSDPCVKDRHTFLQASEAFFHFFATRSSQHLHGNTLVYLNNLYQMYPPDIQQPSKESPGELLFIFFEDWVKQTPITSANPLVNLHRNLLGASGGLHNAGLSPPSDRYFSQTSDKSTHTRPSKSVRMSLCCDFLAQTDVNTDLAAPSSPQERPIRLQCSLCFPFAGLSAERL